MRFDTSVREAVTPPQISSSLSQRAAEVVNNLDSVMMIRTWDFWGESSGWMHEGKFKEDR